MMTNIQRTLAYEDGQHQRKLIGQDQIVAIVEPVVILGDPGLGKSVLTQMLGQQPGLRYYRAGMLVRTAKPESLIVPGERIVIDGLDEVASTVVGGGVEAVLKQLSAMGNPPFILSCRAADWQGAADRIRIEDDYAAAPVLLHLQPFERKDALNFLLALFPAIDAALVLDRLSDRGLEDIYKNPLTLRLLGEVVRETGALPNSRAELLDRACHVMLKEENPRHLDASHVRRSNEDLLLAAGAACAAQLLCDHIGIFSGPYSMVPDGLLHVGEVNKLPFGNAIDDALKTRLFHAEGETRFTPVHRVVAEYLGAKWLAACFDSGVSERRIFNLFLQGDGVPTSLRGLHAWTGHFSEALASRCIAADPYAVLRYGDADTLPLEQARVLLSALAKLSEEDPYFRSEDWGQHSAVGLMRAELTDEILAVIGTSRRHAQLTALLLNTMIGTGLAKKLATTLELMMFDPARYFVERSSAREVIRDTDIATDWEATIRRLLSLGDPDSARLSCNILNDIGAHSVSIQVGVEAILAHIGLTVCEVPKGRTHRTARAYLGDDLFAGFSAEQLVLFLDTLVEYARPSMDGADHSAKAQASDLVRELAAELLETDRTIAPEKIWAWIGWLYVSHGYSDSARQRLTDLFRSDSTIRARLLEYVLLPPCETNTWMAGHSLHDTGLGLYPSSDDLVALLRVLRLRAGDHAINGDMWRGIVQLGRTEEGIPRALRDMAREVANGAPELLASLEEMSQVIVPKWKVEQAQYIAEAEEERQGIYATHRDAHTKMAAEIAAGNFRYLDVAADVYLGQHGEFDESASPQVRLGELLGEELAERALAGFIAVLSRSDLPTAADIANIHCTGKRFLAEAPIVCGVAEIARRGDGIDTINRNTLAAALMAWHRTIKPGSVEETNLGSAIEAVLFRSEHDAEAHFRASIEPQLTCGKPHPEELYRLTHDDQWAALAGRLAVDWLRAYPVLSTYIQSELMACAIENAERDRLRTLLTDTLSRVHLDYETMLLWLSAEYVSDFDNNLVALTEAATEDRNFFWSIRNQIGSERRDFFPRFSVTQLAFVVEAFAPHWPKIDRPSRVTSGDNNPWDASEFIDRTIYAIANSISAEATDALQRLTRGSAQTYIDTARHALMLQRKARRDSEYVAPTVNQLQAVMTNSLPDSVDDMRAYLADRIETVQLRMHGSNTDMWEAYWDGSKPKGENYCRNRLVEHISGQLPPSIRFEPEMHMPGQKRADIAAIRNSIGLPVEIKGQWHTDVWTAPIEQLDAKYTHDWHAEGRGVYVVLWFGDVPRKQLPKHPDGSDRPKTPNALRQMLIDRVPEARRSQIDVFVIDVSRPKEMA